MTPLFQGLDIFAHLNWENRDGAMEFPDSASFNSVTGLFSYGNTISSERLLVSSGFNLDLNPETRLSISWVGQFLDEVNPLEPQDRLTAEMSYKKPDDTFKGLLNMSWGVVPFSALPELGGTITFKISTGIFMSLGAEDMLPLLFQEDRMVVGPYSGPSGKATVTIKISL